MGQRFYIPAFGNKGDSLFNGAPWIQITINERAGKEVRQYFFDSASAVQFVKANCDTDMEAVAKETRRAKAEIISRNRPGQEGRLAKIESDSVTVIRQIETDKAKLIARIQEHFTNNGVR